MKSDQLPTKNQRQLLGVKVVFSEKAFLAVIQAAIVIGLIYNQTHSSPKNPPEQVNPLHNQ